MVKSGLQVALYAYGPVDGVPAGVEIRDAETVLPYATIRRVNPDYPELKRYIARLHFSDLFRFALMRQGIGFWLDTDIYLLRPFTPDPSRFYLAQENEKQLGVSAMYFPQDHPVVADFCGWVDGDEILPPWLGFRRGVMRPLLFRLQGRQLTTVNAGITIFANDGVSRLARKHGIFGEAAPKDDFYHWIAGDSENIFNTGSAAQLLAVPGIKGFHILRKDRCDEELVPGSFFEWAVRNVEGLL
jgi:hypothetical protein